VLVLGMNRWGCGTRIIPSQFNLGHPLSGVCLASSDPPFQGPSILGLLSPSFTYLDALKSVHVPEKAIRHIGGRLISAAERIVVPTESNTESLDAPILRSPIHTPVLVTEVLEFLLVKSGGIYIDCTSGEGGHTEEILRRCIPDGHVFALDSDSDALKAATARLHRYRSNLSLICTSYNQISTLLALAKISSADGIVFDLGLSSLQLQQSGRGFSFSKTEPLDMRFDATNGPTASDIVNHYPVDKLTHILRTYGQEPRARFIARAIVQRRPIYTAVSLAGIVATTAKQSRKGLHPATRTFQAIRIAVNDELRNLQIGLDQAISALKPGGRVAVISYHSLEDRIVKQTFQRESKECICSTEILRCVCGHKQQLQIITKKIITPSSNEKIRNPRSRSARLRVAERIHNIS